MAGEAMAGEAKAGGVGTDEARTAEAESAEAKADEVKAGGSYAGYCRSKPAQMDLTGMVELAAGPWRLGVPAACPKTACC